MKQKTLWIMCGIPASGKSTYLKNMIQTFKFNNAVIVSRDSIRFSLLKASDDYFSKEDQVWTEFVDTINHHIEQDNPKYQNIYVDATHINPSSRKKLLKELNTRNIKVNCISMETPLEACLARNARRQGRARVPDDVIHRMFRSYVRPSTEEGFEEIVIIKGDEISYE